MADLMAMLVIVLRRVICQRKCHLGPPEAIRAQMEDDRLVYVLTDQSLVMAPLALILAALSELWDCLASPAVEIGTEAF